MARKQGAEANTSESDTAAKPAGRFRRSKVGHELRAATAAADAKAIGVRSHSIRFDLTAEIAYHAIREQFFARLNRFLTGLQVLLGTSAIAALVSWFPNYWTVALVTVSAVAGVLLLVIDPAGAARDHRALRSRLQMIRAGLEEFGDSEENLRNARAQMIRVSADAPPGYRGVQALAFNNAVNAIYEEKVAKTHRYNIGFWRGFFANWHPMRGHRFEKENP